MNLTQVLRANSYLPVDDRFGESSRTRLRSCHPYLIILCNQVVQLRDFSVMDGHRTKEYQNKAFKEGHSKLQWPKSQHNKLPSMAVDVRPFPWDEKWGNQVKVNYYYHLAGIFAGVADTMGLKLRWGGDWDSDLDFTDQTFNDLGHFELIE